MPFSPRSAGDPLAKPPEVAECGSCFYSVEWKIQGDPEGNYGACRRYPPNRQRPKERWPGVHRHEWCGEYKSGPGFQPLPGEPVNPPVIGSQLPMPGGEANATD